jgi:hydroxypyruvate reductase
MSVRARAIGRATFVRVFRAALRELDLAARVEAALPSAPHSRPVRIIAIGKAAPAMAAGAIARMGSAIERCLVVAPDDTPVAGLRTAARRAGIAARVTVLRASHPLPDARSARAGAACLETARAGGPATFVVLVSGGASALACAPAARVTLRMKRAVTHAMLASGASVQEINVVRKHLSLLKGGGLARAAAPHRVVTIVASDVIGGSPSDVGSGPSVCDASTVGDARRLLRRFAPSFARVPLARTLPQSSATATRLRAKVVLSPEDLPRAVGRMLAGAGVSVRLLAPSQAPAETLAAEYAVLARAAARKAGGPRAYVRVAEPSVVVTSRTSERRTGSGKGGRSSHLAALVGRALGGALRGGRADRRVRFAALASDGVDGVSGTGGAIVDGRFAAKVEARLGAGALERAITTFDTGTLHTLMKTAISSAPTGQNLADLHVLLIE